MLLVNCGCKKEEKPEKNVPTIPSETNPFDNQELYPYLFDEGSYWVMKMDSIIDTITVLSINKGIYQDIKYGANDENYVIQYYSSQYDTAWYEQLIGAIISRGGIGAGWVYSSDGYSSNNVEMFKHSELAVSGKIYSDVSEARVSVDSRIKQNMILYYAPSNGIVRREHCDTEWNILETWNYIGGMQSVIEVE